MDYKRFGQKIRSERKANKLTQVQLAEKANISGNFLGQIERADKIPSLETTVNIAKSLNTTTDSLIYESKEEDNAILSEISLALSKVDHKDKLLLLDIIKCFLNRSENN